MSTSAIGVVFIVSWLLFAIPAGVFLLLAYGRSKMSGVLWLFFAVVVWPLIGRVGMMAVNLSAPRIMGERGEAWDSGPFGINVILMMNLAESIVGGILLLTAVIVLYRNFAGRAVPAAVNPYLAGQVPPRDVGGPSL